LGRRMIPILPVMRRAGSEYARKKFLAVLALERTGALLLAFRSAARLEREG